MVPCEYPITTFALLPSLAHSSLLYYIMSSAVQWELLKKSNRFLVKRNGVQFSSDPLNVTNVHSFKYSGLANSKAVGVNVVNNKVVLQTRRTRSVRRPAKSIISTPLNRHQRAGSNRAAAVIKAATVGSFYRPDLTKHAIARYHALRRATSLKGGVAKKQTKA